MKYVWIIVGVIMLVRIDDVMNFMNRQIARVGTATSPAELPAADLPATTVIPINEDQALQTSSKQKFFLSLENFLTTPDSALSSSVIEILRQHPTLFSSTTDSQLEGLLLSHRHHFQQTNPIVIGFVLEMMKSLTGGNLSMVRKILTISLDSDPDTFLPLYQSSSDSNCIIAGEFVDNIPEAEKINELIERKTKFDEIALNEGYPEPLKLYAQRCLMVTNISLDKLRSEEPSP